MKCPKCNNKITFNVDVVDDIEFGITVTLEAMCSHCNDFRVESWDYANEVAIELVNKIGT